LGCLQTFGGHCINKVNHLLIVCKHNNIFKQCINISFNFNFCAKCLFIWPWSCCKPVVIVTYQLDNCDSTLGEMLCIETSIIRFLLLLLRFIINIQEVSLLTYNCYDSNITWVIFSYGMHEVFCGDVTMVLCCLSHCISFYYELYAVLGAKLCVPSYFVVIWLFFKEMVFF